MVEPSTTSSTPAGDDAGGSAADPAALSHRPEEIGPDAEAETIGGAAAAALARAREAARAAGLRPSSGGRVPHRRRAPAEPPQSAQGRDPVLLGSNLERFVAERGWQADVAVGSVVARWPAVVGPEVAQHVTPENFEGGVLTVRADSTSWATQLRYMVPILLERLATEVGEGVVTDLRVLGPAGRSWRHGRRSAPGGRGPRDTYG